MKQRLAHYDVPPEFAELSTIGCRVFDDEEGTTRRADLGRGKAHAVLSIPGGERSKDGCVRDFNGWRYVDQDRWTGVVQENNGVCFMAAVRGGEKDLAPYISKSKQ